MNFDDAVDGLISVYDEVVEARSADSSSGESIDWPERLKIGYQASTKVLPIFFDVKALRDEIDSWTDEEKAQKKQNFVERFTLKNKANEEMGERAFDLAVELVDFGFDMAEIRSSK